MGMSGVEGGISSRDLYDYRAPAYPINSNEQEQQPIRANDRTDCVGRVHAKASDALTNARQLRSTPFAFTAKKNC